MGDIRQSLEDLFNNACKPKIYNLFHSWKESVAQGTWDQQDTEFYWPNHNKKASVEAAEEEGESRTVTVHLNHSIYLSKQVRTIAFPDNSFF